jgi:diaminopimelate epimerase
MHGLGNDFMVIDGVQQVVTINRELLLRLSNRHLGVGFDQLLLIEPSSNPSIDFNYRIFNADGLEVGQCGNGARCLALFATYYGLTNKKEISVATPTTQMTLHINADHTVTVVMPPPKTAPKDIPFLAAKEASSYDLPLDNGELISIHTVNVGNPHAVTIVSNLHAIPVEALGGEISKHVYFPEQTNAGFMHIINPEYIALRVYERGCGETNACGSGAVAAAVIGRLYHQLAPRITVKLLGGELLIEWPNEHEPIRLTGPATLVYEGELL